MNLNCDYCGTEFTRLKGSHTRLCSPLCRFVAKIDIRGPQECWEWTGSRTTAGYGDINFTDGPHTYAHRVAYEMHNGPIPEGLQIDHLCRNRGCVNPEHLEPVTNRENTLRGMKGYHNRTTCKRGHDVSDPANVYTQPSTGLRSCRECTRIRNREAYHRKVANR